MSIYRTLAKYAAVTAGVFAVPFSMLSATSKLLGYDVCVATYHHTKPMLSQYFNGHAAPPPIIMDKISSQATAPHDGDDQWKLRVGFKKLFAGLSHASLEIVPEGTIDFPSNPPEHAVQVHGMAKDQDGHVRGISPCRPSVFASMYTGDYYLSASVGQRDINKLYMGGKPEAYVTIATIGTAELPSLVAYFQKYAEAFNARREEYIMHDVPLILEARNSNSFIAGLIQDLATRLDINPEDIVFPENIRVPGYDRPVGIPSL